MVAPKKLSTRTREQNVSIVNDIIKVACSCLKDKKKDIVEVEVDVNMVGHGLRPFGTHFPNDFIDFLLVSTTEHIRLMALVAKILP